MERRTVLCIGNVARGDDGVAHEVASLLGPEPHQDAHVETAVDLDIAMAADLAHVERLILVDAERRATPAVRVQSLAAKATQRPGAHTIDAPTLLALCEHLYGRAPGTTLVSVAAPHMGHGSELSEIARAAAREAAATVRELLSGPS